MILRKRSPSTFINRKNSKMWFFLLGKKVNRSLNIKNTEAHLLASELAEVKEIQAFVAALPDRETLSPEEILGYDEYGLPG